MDESMQDSFKQTKDLIVVDKIKIFPRQIRRGKTLLKSTTFFKGEGMLVDDHKGEVYFENNSCHCHSWSFYEGEGMESIKIYSQKDPLNVA